MKKAPTRESKRLGWVACEGRRRGSEAEADTGAKEIAEADIELRQSVHPFTSSLNANRRDAPGKERRDVARVVGRRLGGIDEHSRSDTQTGIELHVLAIEIREIQLSRQSQFVAQGGFGIRTAVLHLPIPTIAQVATNAQPFEYVISIMDAIRARIMELMVGILIKAAEEQGEETCRTRHGRWCAGRKRHTMAMFAPIILLCLCGCANCCP